MSMSSGERFAGDSAKSTQQDSICWYLTLGECQVIVFANDQDSYSYSCTGCNAQQEAKGRIQTLSQANEHAAQCRAISTRASETSRTSQPS
jgi:hypothetical protein